MSTPISLIDAVRDFCEEVTKQYFLETNKNHNKEPQVVTGYLPTKKSTDKPDFPYVIVRFMEGNDSQDSTVNLKIIVGTYDEEDDSNGWRDVLNILQRIRTELFKRQALANKYRVELPFKYLLPEDQPYPEWIGWIETKWIIPSIVLEQTMYMDME